MREILFRGKRVDNGEWAYGSYVHIVQYKESTDYIADEEPDQYVVIPETVGQYTGLTDKNGLTKIFEKDILSGHLDELFPEDESRYPVVWHDYGWHIKLWLQCRHHRRHRQLRFLQVKQRKSTAYITA